MYAMAASCQAYRYLHALQGGAVLQGYFLYLSISLLAPGRFDKWVSKEDAETPKSEMDKALRTKEEYEREKKQRNDS